MIIDDGMEPHARSIQPLRHHLSVSEPLAHSATEKEVTLVTTFMCVNYHLQPFSCHS